MAEELAAQLVASKQQIEELRAEGAASPRAFAYSEEDGSESALRSGTE
ncbi:hypothetical protein [Glycomyces sp. NRRL B-16210]|nr:hypothetical protein [Glycomyces sp. NRRL B-16210]